jgi:hypothetical protein
MVQNGQLTHNTHVWKQGMAGWEIAGNVQELSNLFSAVPSPPPTIAYSVSVNGQTAGPFNLPQLQQMVQNGQLTQNTHVWKQGMAAWEIAGNVQELSNLFGAVPPPPPPVV